MLPIKRINQSSVEIYSKEGIAMLFPGQEKVYQGFFPIRTRLDVFRPKPVTDLPVDENNLIVFGESPVRDKITRCLLAGMTGYTYIPRTGIWVNENEKEISMDEMKRGHVTRLCELTVGLYKKFGLDHSHLDLTKYMASFRFRSWAKTLLTKYRSSISSAHYPIQIVNSNSFLIPQRSVNSFKRRAAICDVILIVGKNGGIRTMVEVLSATRSQETGLVTVQFTDYGRRHRLDGELYAVNLTAFLEKEPNVQNELPILGNK